MDCPYCQKQDIAVHDRQTSRLRCRDCKKTWVTHRQALHYGLRTPEIKIRRALQLLCAGLSIRKIAELVQVSPSSVLRWKKKCKHFLT